MTCPVKWFLGSKILKDEYQLSEAKFLNIEASEDLGDKILCLEEGREYLQIQFRKETPGAHMEKLKAFWRMPDGPQLLNSWFEWLVDGSRDGSLVFSIQDHIDTVVKYTARILGKNRGEEWDVKLDEVRTNCQTMNGNDTMLKVFIIRQLAISWKNSPEKLFFVEGEDEVCNSSKQPFIHILKVAQNGEEDYDEKVVISVRVGTTTVFDKVSLTEGLAAIIQLCFVFNLLYPSDCDDVFNYVQRVLARFGPSEGARNMKGVVKKKFQSFQCDLADIIMLEKAGTVKKLLV